MINLYRHLRGFKTVESAGNFGLGPAARLSFKAMARQARFKGMFGIIMRLRWGRLRRSQSV
jgi:hypothetical protein